MLLLVGVSFAANTNDTVSSKSSTVNVNDIISSEIENSDNEIVLNSQDKTDVETKTLNKTSKLNPLKTVKSASNNSMKDKTINKINIFYVNPKANVLVQNGSIKTPYADIDFAISKCLKNHDNILYLSSGNYELYTPLQINTNITIIGAGKYKTKINCNNHQGFRMSPGTNLTLRNILVENAFYSQGGAILASENSKLLINNCYFKNNHANNGAVLFGSGGNIKCNITNSIFHSNKAIRFGAALQLGGYNSVYNINNCIFSYNILNDTNYDHSTGGAAIYAGTFAIVNVENCTFKNNKALWGNAILNGNHATLNVNNSNFNDNSAEKNNGGFHRTKGGAIAIGSGDAIISNSSFTKNKADIGGAISVNSGENVLISSCKFIENLGYEQAGAISNFGTLTIKNSTFLKNDGTKRGGAILNIGNTEIFIENSTFKDNKVRTYRVADPLQNIGGAIAISGICYTFSLTNTIFNHNVAFYGGAIFSGENVQDITMHNTTFHNNSACYGGAMFFIGETIVRLTNNKFEYNRALRKGGSIYINGSVHCTFKNTKFNKNIVSTVNDGDGGVIYIACYSRLAFNYCSFTNNIANLKGGIICSMSTVTISMIGTNITKNKATKGSAIYLDNSKDYGSSKTKINIESSTFIGNSGKYVFYSVKKYNVTYNNLMISTSWWGKNVMTSNVLYNFYQKNHFILTLSLNNQLIDTNWNKNSITLTLNRTNCLNKDLILTITYIKENNSLRYTDVFLPSRTFYLNENNKKDYKKNLYAYYHLNLSLKNITVRLDNQVIKVNIVS